MTAKHNVVTSLALAVLVVCATATAHEDLYHAVEPGDVHVGRPFVDPKTGYLFVDPDGMRDLRWKSADMTAVRVADNDYTGVPIVTWQGLGRVETRDNAQLLVGGLFMFDYDDRKLNETDVKGTIEVLIDSNNTDSVGLRFDHIAEVPTRDTVPAGKVRRTVGFIRVRFNGYV